MRRVYLLFAVLRVVPLLGSDSPKEYDDATTSSDSLEGSWDRVSAEHNGVPVAFAGGVLHFRVAGRTWREETKGSAALAGTYRVEGVRRHTNLDLFHDEGNGTPSRYIYRVEGDTLRVGFTSRDRRPDG